MIDRRTGEISSCLFRNQSLISGLPSENLRVAWIILNEKHSDERREQRRVIRFSRLVLLEVSSTIEIYFSIGSLAFSIQSLSIGICSIVYFVGRYLVVSTNNSLYSLVRSRSPSWSLDQETMWNPCKEKNQPCSLSVSSEWTYVNQSCSVRRIWWG